MHTAAFIVHSSIRLLTRMPFVDSLT